jgi:SAM-dependent methyltransferase
MARTVGEDREVKIDIGCGGNKREGFLGIDIVPGPGVDYVLDITKDRLPFEDNSVSQVFSSHCFEHLVEHSFILREITRVSRNGAIVEIWIPYLKNNDAFLAGHKTFWSENLWKHICLYYDDLHQRDFPGRLVLRQFKYLVYPGIEASLASVRIPLSFALEHMFNIAYEFCAVMTVVKDIEKARTMKAEPESYVGYSREGPFTKVSSKGQLGRNALLYAGLLLLRFRQGLDILTKRKRSNNA